MPSDYKQQSIDRRDERHTKTPEDWHRPPNKNKRAREVIVEWRWNPEKAPGWWANIMREKDSEWTKYKAYRSVAEAEHAIANMSRKHSIGFEYRIQQEQV